MAAKENSPEEKKYFIELTENQIYLMKEVLLKLLQSPEVKEQVLGNSDSPAQLELLYIASVFNDYYTSILSQKENTVQ